MHGYENIFIGKIHTPCHFGSPRRSSDCLSNRFGLLGVFLMGIDQDVLVRPPASHFRNCLISLFLFRGSWLIFWFSSAQVRDFPRQVPRERDILRSQGNFYSACYHFDHRKDLIIQRVEYFVSRACLKLEGRELAHVCHEQCVKFPKRISVSSVDQDEESRILNS